MKYWRKTTKWPFIAQRRWGARLSLPKYRNDRLELHSDCFQPLENRQEFGHTTKKTGDLVQSIFKTPSNTFCERSLARSSQMGGFLLSLARRSPKQARSINHVKKRIKKEEKWSVFCFNSCSVPGHPEDSNLSGDSLKWRIWEFRRNIPCYIYSRVIIIFMWRLWQSKAGCLNLRAPSSPLTSDCIKEGYVSQFYRLLLIFLQVRRSFVSFFVTFFTDGTASLFAFAGTERFNKTGGRLLSCWLRWGNCIRLIRDVAGIHAADSTHQSAEDEWISIWKC